MTTTTKPRLDEAMTAAELFAHQKDLASRLGGGKAEVHIMLSGGRATVLIYPNGGIANKSQFLYGATWPEAIENARQWIANHKITSRDTTIRKMALAIIELTDEHTKCTDTMLKRRDFSVEQIAEFHELACARAGEMAGNAPFQVEFGA